MIYSKAEIENYNLHSLFRNILNTLSKKNEGIRTRNNAKMSKAVRGTLAVINARVPVKLTRCECVVSNKQIFRAFFSYLQPVIIE